MDFTIGDCSATLIGPFIDSNTGINIPMGDIALCPDGILYGFGLFDRELFEINPVNAEATLIMTLPRGYNALACSPDFRLFGVGGLDGEVVEFFTNSLTYNVVGYTGYFSAGDLVYYQDLWYHTVVDGLLEIPNIDAPETNQLISTVGPHAGITVSPNTCNSLILPETEYSEIDLTTGELTPICDIGWIGGAGLTSMFEFQTPPTCPLILDLDDDDSSGLPDADFNGDIYTCATEDGLNIADVDVFISSYHDIVDITINIEMGLLDQPNEILVLNTANNITITGSGTDQLILSNTGSATLADFELAISNVKYINQKPYPIPGTREIKVVFEDTEGAFSNEAFSYITVIQFEDVMVDLGPNITACDDEILFITAGQGDTYNWSTGEKTQSIFTNLPGEYAVTVTEYPKCPGIDTIEIFHLPIVNFYLDIEEPICTGEDLNMYVWTNYEGAFDIELLNISNNDIYYFQDSQNGDILTISNIDNTFLQINQIIPQIEDICAIDGSGPLGVVVNEVVHMTIDTSICQNESIFFNGVYLNEEGTYLDTLQSALNCDELITLNLEVHPLYVDTMFKFSCDTADVGVYEDSLFTIMGCDSIIVIDIALLPSHDMIFTDTICYFTNDSIDEFVLINQFGCDSLITINKIYNAPYLDLGLDQSILFGEEVILDVNTNITEGDFLWSSDPFFDLEEFDDLTIMPKEDITITLQISSSEGCEVTDQININVKSGNPLIFPNVFSPNNDGINDIFTFNLDDYNIESIESLFIFDRWGNKVYSINNVDSAALFGWNGEMNGQKVTSGVYILYTEMRMLSGEKISIVQDLTVLH